MAKLTKAQFSDKMDYEGGIYELAAYGLDPQEIKNKELSELWQDFLAQYEQCEMIRDLIDNVLAEEE